MSGQRAGTLKRSSTDKTNGRLILISHTLAFPKRDLVWSMILPIITEV